MKLDQDGVRISLGVVWDLKSQIGEIIYFFFNAQISLNPFVGRTEMKHAPINLQNRFTYLEKRMA